MAALLDRDRTIGAVGPKIRYPDGTIQYTCARNLPNLLTGFLDLSGLAYKYPRGRITGSWQMGYWDHNDERNVDAISGACMMVRREVIDRIGLLDEKYFMYGEDIDWCYRIRRDGWEIRYLPSAEITHFAGQSSKLFANIVMEDYRSMCRFLKSKDGFVDRRALSPARHRPGKHVVIVLVDVPRDIRIRSRRSQERDNTERCRAEIQNDGNVGSRNVMKLITGNKRGEAS